MIIKKILAFLSLCFIGLFARGQIDHFQLGIWSFSYDYSSSFFNAGISTTIGNSTDFLNLFKESGFNTIQVEYQLFKGPAGIQYASSNPSKSFLRRADSLGLKIVLSCPDLYIDRHDTIYSIDSSHSQYDSIHSANALNYYANENALLGFSVSDEPHHFHFNDVGRVFSDITNYDPNLLRLSNLKSADASDTILGFPGQGYIYAYPRYVEDFISTTNPNIISFDSYPLYLYHTYGYVNDTALWPRSFYFNFDVIARAAESHNIPFVFIPTPIKIQRKEVFQLKNLSELRYVVFSGLMHGTKGLNYWHAGHIIVFGTA